MPYQLKSVGKILRAAGLWSCPAIVMVLFSGFSPVADLHAQEKITHHHPDTAERRLLGAHEQQAWRGVGRFDLVDGYCTAAMIGSDLVLTAAHCLFHEDGQRRQDARLKFEAGWREGAGILTRGVSGSVVHPDYKEHGDGKISVANIQHDLAILRIDTPVLSSYAPSYGFADMPDVGGAVIVPSYGRGRDLALSLQDPCHVIGREGDVAQLDCDVDHGSSGSPVFVFENGNYKIAGVISALGGGYSFAVAAKDQIPILQRSLEADIAHRQSTKVGDGALKRLHEDAEAGDDTGWAFSGSGSAGARRKVHTGGSLLPGGQLAPGE